MGRAHRLPSSPPKNCSLALGQDYDFFMRKITWESNPLGEAYTHGCS